MSDDLHRISLEFFGKVIASSTHEIKNRLAVINEQAGLLEDHVSLIQRGHQLDAERLQHIATTTQRQVAMANALIKNLNQFAHSTDVESGPVNVNEALMLTAALAKRTADMRSVSLKVLELAEPRTIETSFFNLLNLMWICTVLGIQRTSPHHELTAQLHRVSGKTVLHIKAEAVTSEELSTSMESDADQLAATLQMSVDRDMAAGSIHVHLE